MTIEQESILRRPQIQDTVEHGGPILLLMAEAGYGKTSLLAKVAQESPSPVCWLSLVETDRDPAVLIDRWLSRLRSLFPELIWQPEPAPADAEIPLVRMLAELGPLVVILDDYHLVNDSPAIQTFMARLLLDLPPNIRLLIASRTPPDLPVAKLVARGMLTAVGPSAFRFQPGEVQSVLAGVGLEVNEAEAVALTRQHDGWITGILLATYPRWETRPLTSPPAAPSTTPAGFHSLARQLLDRQPVAMQRFLIEAAVLDEITPAGCAALGLGAIQLPAGLERVLGQIQLATAEPTWRLHPLWHEFLRHRLHTSDPSRWQQLHQQAARFYDAAGNLAAAVRHWLAAEAYPIAIARMEQAVVEWFMLGRWQTLLDWVEALPAGWRSSAPRLLLWAAKVLTDRSDLAQAQTYLDLAEPGLASSPERLAALYTQRGLVALRQGDARLAQVAGQRALVLAEPGQPQPRAAALRVLGGAYFATGELELAMTTLRAALEQFRTVGNGHDIAVVLQELGIVAYRYEGRAVASEYLYEALVLRRRLGAPGPLAALLNDIAYGHYLWGEPEQAQALYEEALTEARRAGDRRSEAYILTGLADLWRDQTAWDRAMPLYQTALSLARESVPDLSEYLYAAQAIAYLRQNAPGLACLVVEAGQQALDAQAGVLLQAVRGAVQLAQGQAPAGLEQIARAVAAWNRPPDWELARTRLWLTQARLLAGQEDLARQELEQVIALVGQSGTQYFLSVELGYAGPVREFASQARIAIPQPAPRPAVAPVAGWGADEQFAVYALGPARIVRGGQETNLIPWRTGMAREIFFYLLFHGPASREELVEIFWPETEPELASRTFRTLLSRLRGALGSRCIVFEDQHYRLGIEVWTDVAQFESLVAQARLLPNYDPRTSELWQRAVDLVRGDFLANLSQPWLIPWRQHLHDLHVEALASLASCYQTQGNQPAAIQTYRRAIHLAPLREDIYRMCMSCLHEAGRTTEALTLYNRLVDILSVELGVPPAPETGALYQRLRAAGRTRAK